jgi:hypothetical protein
MDWYSIEIDQLQDDLVVLVVPELRLLVFGRTMGVADLSTPQQNLGLASSIMRARVRLRRTSRLVLLDEHDRVLLLKVEDPTVVDPASPTPKRPDLRLRLITRSPRARRAVSGAGRRPRAWRAGRRKPVSSSRREPSSCHTPRRACGSDPVVGSSRSST